MATSGSKNFSVTRNDIINSALRKLGEFDSSEAPGGDETADASQALNILINELSGVAGADIWLRQEITLFIQKSQESYQIGSTGDHVTSSYVETTLSADASSGTNSITLTSITDVTAADYVGIKMDDGSIHWTTVANLANPMTIDDVTDDDAASGNAVYFYTTKAYRPHTLLYALRRDGSDYDISIELIGDNEYRFLSQKGQTGVPNQVHYRQTLTNGTLFVWPTGDGDTDKIVLTAQYYPDDFDAASDNPEFPIEWTSALIWGLADSLSAEYGLSDREQKTIAQRSQAKINQALDADTENASVQFTVNNEGMTQ